MDISQNCKRLKQRNYLVTQKKLIDKTKNRENVPRFEVVEVVLVECNLVGNQQNQEQENVLNDADFCNLKENIKNIYWIKDQIL